MSDSRDPSLSPSYNEETAAPFEHFQLEVSLLAMALQRRDRGRAPNRVRVAVFDGDGFPITGMSSMPAAVIPELSKLVAQLRKSIEKERPGVPDLTEFRARKGR